MRPATRSIVLSVIVCAALAGCNTTDALNPAAIRATETNPALQGGDAATEPAGTAAAPAAAAPAGPVAPAAAPPAAPALPPPAAPGAVPAAPAPPTTVAATPASAASAVRLQFAPIVGATVGAATSLSRRLSTEATEHGLSVVGATSAPTHLMKGYFSAIGEGRETVVIFVWDVLGPDGNRLHRIQGQERVAKSAPDVWSVVPARTMETIADRTIDELSQWLAAPQG